MQCEHCNILLESQRDLLDEDIIHFRCPVCKSEKSITLALGRGLAFPIIGEDESGESKEQVDTLDKTLTDTEFSDQYDKNFRKKIDTLIASHDNTIKNEAPRKEEIKIIRSLTVYVSEKNGLIRYGLYTDRDDSLESFNGHVILECVKPIVEEMINDDYENISVFEKP